MGGGTEREGWWRWCCGQWRSGDVMKEGFGVEKFAVGEEGWEGEEVGEGAKNPNTCVSVRNV